jgi:hypothetical protein
VNAPAPARLSRRHAVLRVLLFLLVAVGGMAAFGGIAYLALRFTGYHPHIARDQPLPAPLLLLGDCSSWARFCSRCG